MNRLQTGYAYRKGREVYDKNVVDEHLDPTKAKYWICCRKMVQSGTDSPLLVKKYRLKDYQPEESDDSCDANHPGYWVDEESIGTDF